MVGDVRAGCGITVIQHTTGAQGRLASEARRAWSKGSTVLHGFLGVAHSRQYLVLHLNEQQGLLGDVGACGRYCGDGVPLIERLIDGHDVVAQEPHVVDRSFGEVDHSARRLRQIGGRDDGMHAGSSSAWRVLIDDSGMGVRAAQNLAVQHSRQPNIGPVARLARDFLDPVVADGPRANDVVFLVG